MGFKRENIAISDAEAIAADALGHLAADPVLIGRFLDLSGIEPSEIRRAAQSPGFLAGVLDFLMRHEPDLLAFAAASGHSPETISLAHALLLGRGAVSH